MVKTGAMDQALRRHWNNKSPDKCQSHSACIQCFEVHLDIHLRRRARQKTAKTVTSSRVWDAWATRRTGAFEIRTPGPTQSHTGPLAESWTIIVLLDLAHASTTQVCRSPNFPHANYSRTEQSDLLCMAHRTAKHQSFGLFPCHKPHRCALLLCCLPTLARTFLVDKPPKRASTTEQKSHCASCSSCQKFLVLYRDFEHCLSSCQSATPPRHTLPGTQSCWLRSLAHQRNPAALCHRARNRQNIHSHQGSTSATPLGLPWAICMSRPSMCLRCSSDPTGSCSFHSWASPYYQQKPQRREPRLLSHCSRLHSLELLKRQSPYSLQHALERCKLESPGTKGSVPGK